jgi:hypothetical protein
VDQVLKPIAVFPETCLTIRKLIGFLSHVLSLLVERVVLWRATLFFLKLFFWWRDVISNDLNILLILKVVKRLW